MAQAGENPEGLVFTWAITAGIKRDGVPFESASLTDGTWVRFQRNVPKKMAGYKSSFRTNNGVPRGMLTQSIAGSVYITIGNSSGVDLFVSGSSDTTGNGPFTATFLSTYGQQTIATVISQTSFTVAGNVTGQFSANSKIVFNSASSTTLFTVQNSTVSGTAPSQTTTVTTTTNFTGTPTSVFSYGTPLVNDPNRQWQFDVISAGGFRPLQFLAHGALNLQYIDSAIAQAIYVGSVSPTNGNQWTLSPLADVAGSNPTGQVIQVDGGMVALYPYIFAYGSGGLLINNHVSNNPNEYTLFDWNGPTANQTNVAAGKIIKGFPIRGGTASPSGLFWSTDSLIRVSFSGQAPNYWNYDLLSSKISVLSSNCIVSGDGSFYWIGVDRFYYWDGTTKVLKNEMNYNWFFKNLNYSARQKVWGTYVPAYSEIWWFYPRGSATECTDVIIYQTSTGLWYDAGSAEGARRSCGYTTEVLQYPLYAGWEKQNNFVGLNTVIATPSGGTAPATNQFYLSGDQSSSFRAGFFVGLSDTDIADTYSITSSVFNFNQSATLVTMASSPTGNSLNVGTPVWVASSSGYATWTHEIGVDKVDGTSVSSIYSSFTTNDVSWVGGNFSSDAPQGVDKSVRLIRIEPNFLQSGQMRVTPLGRSYASSDVNLVAKTEFFEPNTTKIYFRDVDFRQLRLKFESDAIGGDYETGRLLANVGYGANRPNE